VARVPDKIIVVVELEKSAVTQYTRTFNHRYWKYQGGFPIFGGRPIFTYEQVKLIFRKKIYVPLWEMDYRAS
jgi:hypothetical protein